MPDELQPPLKSDERLRAKFLRDLGQLMGQPNFRSFLSHLIEDKAWCWGYHHGLDAPDRMVFAEGKREVGMKLVAVAMAVGDANFIKMQTEARNLKLQYQLEDEKAAQQ